MSIRYPQIVTVETQTEKVNKRIALYQYQLDIVTKTLNIIKNYDGKKLTAHIATAVKKDLGENYHVNFERQYGTYHLNIWQIDNYNDKISMLLGYEGSSRFGEGGTVKYNNILEHNKCYTLNAERLPRLKEGLKHIKSLVEKRDKAIELLQQVTEEATKYEMDYDFDLEK